MTSVGRREDFVDHGLYPDFHGLYIIFFKQGENLFIQSIGSSGDANGIDEARSEEGLDLFQITNLIIFMDCCEASTIEGNLFFPILFLRWESIERGFNKVSNRRGGGESSARSLLIAEEATLTAAQIG
jgi:hypothetical protein